MTRIRLTVKDVVRAYINKLGAIQERSGDHIYFYLEFQGSEYTIGKLSHSWGGTLDDTQVLMVARKLRLQKREFELWVICDMENPEMLSIWQERRDVFT